MEHLEEVVRESFVMPSPGEQGAFSCSQCGSTELALATSPIGEVLSRLFCTKCWNYLDFTVVEVTSGPTGKR